MLFTAARDQRLDGLEQLRFLVRLAEVVVDADLDGARAVFLAYARGDHDDGDAGEARIREVVEAAGFTRFRRVAETPFNLVFEARP